jgi:phage FluMu protein Com
MERNIIRCNICNKEISKSNWSKHIKTKKHLDNIRLQTNNQNEIQRNNTQIKCGICNILIYENEFNEHLKSDNHKNNSKLLQNKLKVKIKSLNIIRQRKRHFNDLDFETDGYIVKKSEEALERCFLTLRITPKNEINLINVLIEEFLNLNAIMIFVQ